MRSTIVALVCAVAQAFALAMAIGAAAQAQQSPALVVTDTVRMEPFSQRSPVIGRVVTRESASIAARVTGPVQTVLVEVGDRVEAGQPVMQIDRERIAAELELAESELQEMVARSQAALANQALAEQDIDRIERLRGSAAYSQARFDTANQELLRAAALASEARSNQRQAEIAVELSRLDLNNTVVRAPFPGIVVEVEVSSGEFVSVGAPVLTVINDANIEIEIAVSADRVASLEAGTVLEIALGDRLAGQPGDQVMLPAAVRAVIPVEHSTNRTQRVRLTPAFDLDEHGPAVGQSVTVMVPVDARSEVLTVHKDAVMIDITDTSVFVVSNGVAIPRPIEIGASLGHRYEVLSGLAPGEEVVIRGNETLRPGQPVQIPGQPAVGGGEDGASDGADSAES